jgi:hypothetical protein
LVVFPSSKETLPPLDLPCILPCDGDAFLLHPLKQQLCQSCEVILH